MRLHVSKLIRPTAILVLLACSAAGGRVLLRRKSCAPAFKPCQSDGGCNAFSTPHLLIRDGRAVFGRLPDLAFDISHGDKCPPITDLPPIIQYASTA